MPPPYLVETDSAQAAAAAAAIVAAIVAAAIAAASEAAVAAAIAAAVSHPPNKWLSANSVESGMQPKAKSPSAYATDRQEAYIRLRHCWVRGVGWDGSGLVALHYLVRKMGGYVQPRYRDHSNGANNSSP